MSVTLSIIMQTANQFNPIGSWAVILHDGRQLVGTVIDTIAGTTTPKRIRVQRGTLQGEVLQPSQYEFKSWLSEVDVDE